MQVSGQSASGEDRIYHFHIFTIPAMGARHPISSYEEGFRKTNKQTNQQPKPEDIHV